MSNTIGHRVSTYSKFALGKQQADAEKLSKERRRENISRLVNERNPKLAVDKKRDDEMVERCRDGLKNSYLADFSKIFERVMLWPFVPGLKTGEAVTAGARLVLFSCAAFGCSPVCIEVHSATVHLAVFPTSFDLRSVAVNIGALQSERGS